MTSTLSPRDKELVQMPCVASQFPILFLNGNRVDTFKGHCLNCSLTIPDTLLRGTVQRPLERVAVIEAVGICHECRLVTRFLSRVYDDLSLTMPVGETWQRWCSKPVSFSTRFIRALRRMLG